MAPAQKSCEPVEGWLELEKFIEFIVVVNDTEPRSQGVVLGQIPVRHVIQHAGLEQRLQIVFQKPASMAGDCSDTAQSAPYLLNVTSASRIGSVSIGCDNPEPGVYVFDLPHLPLMPAGHRWPQSRPSVSVHCTWGFALLRGLWFSSISRCRLSCRSAAPPREGLANLPGLFAQQAELLRKTRQNSPRIM